MIEVVKNTEEAIRSLGDRARAEVVDCRQDLNTYSMSRLSYILDAKQRFGANALLFGAEEQNSECNVPWAILFDYSHKAAIESGASAMHHRLWVYGKIPFAIFFTQTEILIYDCLSDPKIRMDAALGRIYETKTFETHPLVTKGTKKSRSVPFSVLIQFLNGAIWKSDAPKKVERKNSSHEQILSRLTVLRNELIKPRKSKGRKTTTPPSEFVHRLILMCILIKYLEEREDNTGGSVFDPEFFTTYARQGSRFIDVLHHHDQLVRLFNALNEPTRFNGSVFLLNPNEQEWLTQIDLGLLIRFFDPSYKMDGTMIMFQEYQPEIFFRDLPVELISNIYQQLVVLGSSKEEKKGIVFTPPYLVDFLLEQSMPWNQLCDDFKVLDPACGSGVFLVSAFKRLVLAWRQRNNWQEPTIEVLKRILGENIIGVELKQNAAQIARFSLLIALCDELNPRAIRDLKFDVLQGRILDGDFFDLVLESKLQPEYHLVLGNPPFMESFPERALDYVLERKNRLQISKLPDIPNKQLCLAFYEASFSLLKRTIDGKYAGKVCMIQQAGPVIFNDSKTAIDFREYLFQYYPVNEVWDFTHLKEFLYLGADVATVALISGFEANESIQHVVARTTYAAREKLYFEFDRYDYHWIERLEVGSFKYFWKTNLFGGGRLHDLVHKFQKMKSIGRVIEEKVEWYKGQGFKPAEESKAKRREVLEAIRNLSVEEELELVSLRKYCKEAKYLTKKPYYQKNSKTGEIVHKGFVEHKYFESRRDERLFKGPLLLISETIPFPTRLIKLNVEAAYSDGITGISTSKGDVQHLEQIAAILGDEMNAKLWTLLVSCTSSRYLVGKATATNQKDFLSLPWIDDFSSSRLDDFDGYLRDDALDNQVPQFHQGEKAKVLKPIVEDEEVAILNKYGFVVKEILNEIYDDFIALEPMKSNDLICFPFSYKKPNAKALRDVSRAFHDGNLKGLIQNDADRSARFMRIIRFYHKNMTFLIKPNILRYWTPIIAARDADAMMVDFFDQGY
jgi:hypothetical protein